ncbi:uncharacterized protein LOC128888992 isoform X1 [Hylaeus anthracinus]|uniref:uncharacterized protein LOC128888992 isoform X1 n=1 Tax=Hylaeus anthracinus TaxID=313031 RepID=UPI0023B8DE2D|nr:uncharacterized protein LOC128888992 isoform X1 [Hylaeus anthracinus]
MNDTTESNVTVVNSARLDRQLTVKESGSWLDERSINGNQGQTFSFEPSYYKFQDNIVSISTFIDVSTNVQWWKDVSNQNMNIQPECQQEPVPSSNYPLTNYSTNTQPNRLEQAGSHGTKSIIPKQPKKPKTIRQHREPLKRTKHPELWKVNVKKNARLRGEEYIGVGGRLVPAKAMGPPCKCRMRCIEKIDESAREELHNIFWKTCSWEQRKQYVALSVKESPKQRTRCRGNVKSEHRRQITFTYSLLSKGEFITVCKCMFLSTFAVSEKFVRHVMDKKRTSPSGVIGPDQRGRHTPKTKKSETVKDRVREHINSFPTEKSTNSKDRMEKRYLDSALSIVAMHKLYVSKCKDEGIPESDIVKESYYREMFKTEFNLAFKQTKPKENAQLINSTI